MYVGIVERNEKGRILKGFPVPFQSAKVGCDGNHVHVKLEDRRKWCYDIAAEVEVI